MDENSTSSEEAKTNQENGETGEKKGKDESSGGKQLKGIIDGTARLGRSIGETFKGVADVFRGRDYVVMVRVNKENLDRIDELVHSGIFKSRSESAAFLIARGVQANSEIYDRIKDKVDQISKLKEELQSIVNIGGE